MLKQLWQGYTAFSSLNLLKQMSNKGKIKLERNPKLGCYNITYTIQISDQIAFSQQCWYHRKNCSDIKRLIFTL